MLRFVSALALAAYYLVLIAISFLDVNLQLSVFQGIPSLVLPWAQKLELFLFLYPLLAIFGVVFLGRVLANYAALANASSDTGVRRAKGLLGLSFIWIGFCLLIAGIPMTRSTGNQIHREASLRTHLAFSQTMLETYYVEHQKYPESMADLQQRAQQGPNAYWKNMSNPYPGTVWGVFEDQQAGELFAEVNAPAEAGQMVYQPTQKPDGSPCYQLQAYDGQGQFLQGDGQVIRLSCL